VLMLIKIINNYRQHEYFLLYINSNHTKYYTSLIFHERQTKKQPYFNYLPN